MRTKFFYWLGCLLLALTFGSCSSEDDEVEAESDSDLPGVWVVDSEYHYYKEDGEMVDEWSYSYETAHDVLKFTIYDNGTVNQKQYYQGNCYYDETGTWTLKSGTLTIKIGDEDTLVYSIKTLNETTLVIEKYLKYKEDGVQCECYDLVSFHREN
jgi:hypothetical protein